ncbi:hypothetical protein IE53DRAFT_366134 [Violaceomyces palustris]|uniref:Uncharacterized protein n=1 Tax=Violaceomyces palustris TaxID=1673888 RepID=A0ACD0P683_9BASI|nr:hypothetical protein IE53DRAFT_366134 [Violaceomyces palustris]
MRVDLKKGFRTTFLTMVTRLCHLSNVSSQDNMIDGIYSYDYVLVGSPSKTDRSILPKVLACCQGSNRPHTDWTYYTCQKPAKMNVNRICEINGDRYGIGIGSLTTVRLNRDEKPKTGYSTVEGDDRGDASSGPWGSNNIYQQADTQSYIPQDAVSTPDPSVSNLSGNYLSISNPPSGGTDPPPLNPPFQENAYPPPPPPLPLGGYPPSSYPPPPGSYPTGPNVYPPAYPNPYPQPYPNGFTSNPASTSPQNPTTGDNFPTTSIRKRRQVAPEPQPDPKLASSVGQPEGREKDDHQGGEGGGGSSSDGEGNATPLIGDPNKTYYYQGRTPIRTSPVAPKSNEYGLPEIKLCGQLRMIGVGYCVLKDDANDPSKEEDAIADFENGCQGFRGFDVQVDMTTGACYFLNNSVD